MITRSEVRVEIIPRLTNEAGNRRVGAQVGIVGVIFLEGIAQSSGRVVLQMLADAGNVRLKMFIARAGPSRD